MTIQGNLVRLWVFEYEHKDVTGVYLSMRNSCILSRKSTTIFEYNKRTNVVISQYLFNLAGYTKILWKTVNIDFSRLRLQMTTLTKKCWPGAVKSTFTKKINGNRTLNGSDRTSYPGWSFRINHLVDSLLWRSQGGHLEETSCVPRM